MLTSDTEIFNKDIYTRKGLLFLYYIGGGLALQVAVAEIIVNEKLHISK